MAMPIIYRCLPAMATLMQMLGRSRLNKADCFGCWPGGGVAAWLVPKLRLAMEWSSIPVLVIATQLPQGAVLYWLSSLTFTLGQVYTPLQSCAPIQPPSQLCCA